VWTKPAGEDRVTVDDEMLRRDRRADIRTGTLDELYRFFRGDMLEDDFEGREIASYRLEHPVDKHRLAIKDVHDRIGHLAMDAQHHADLLHAGKRRIDILNVGDA